MTANESPSSSPRRTAGLGASLQPSAAERSGAKRWFTTRRARSGTTLPATPPSTNTACSASRYSQPSITGRRSSVVREPRRAPARGGGSALRPIHGRAVWARAPGEDDLDAHRPLAAGLDGAVGRFAEQGDVALEQVGPLAEEPPEPVVDRVDLLGLVEDVGDVDGGLRHRAGQLEHHRQRPTSCRTRRSPRACRPRSRSPRCSLTGTVSVCPAMSAAVGSSEVGAGDEVVTRPVDARASGHLLELGLEHVGDGAPRRG